MLLAHSVMLEPGFRRTMLVGDVGFARPADLATVLRIASRADGTLADWVAVHDVSGDEEFAVADVLFPLEWHDHLVRDLDEEHSIAACPFVLIEWRVGEPDAVPSTVSQLRSCPVAKAFGQDLGNCAYAMV